MKDFLAWLFIAGLPVWVFLGLVALSAVLGEGRDGLRNAAEGLLKVLDPRAVLADFKRMTDEEVRACLEAARRAAAPLRDALEPDDGDDNAPA